jgi:hypothetical protein
MRERGEGKKKKRNLEKSTFFGSKTFSREREREGMG